MLVFFSLLLAGCDGLDPSIIDPNVVTPVYQGMVITKDLTTVSTHRENIALSHEIDQDDPFDNFGGETIETEIQTTYQTDTTPMANYFADVNETLYITVKVYNPTSYEILSFTINGVKYQSFQFEDGSNSENLIMEVTSGEIIGIKEFTIDQIKYVDGTAIKDVPIEGNQTVKVGVGFTQAPLIEVSAFNIHTTSVTMSVAMSDNQKVLETIQGYAKVVLYDGTDIVDAFDLSEGLNNVIFEDLEIDTLYQYAVIMKYDMLDGNHQKLSVLSKLAFYTQALIEISTSPTQESTTFTYVINDFVEEGSVTTIKIYKDNILVHTLSTFETLEFNELLSDTEYEIRVTYVYDLNDGKGPQTVISKQMFSTLTKAAPSLTISNIVSGQEAISFGLSIVDTDLVGALSKIRVLKNQVEVKTLTNLELRSIENLQSNTIYILEVSYTYDLNDGQGTQTLVITQQFKTLEKQIPLVNIKDLNIQQANFQFALEIVDADLVGSLTSITLYQGQTLIKSLTDLSTRIFSDLLSNNNYTLVVLYTYNLNDGMGQQEIRVTTPILTLAKQPPVSILNHLVINQTDVSFDFIFNQNGLEGATLTNIELFDGATLVTDYNEFTLSKIEDLLTNHDYTIKISYTYDLTDGNGVQSGSQSFTLHTLAKQIPTIQISTIESDYMSIDATVEVVDLDEVGQITSAVVKKNGVTQASLSSFDVISFTNLDPDLEYVVEITYAYDLKDGLGIQTVKATSSIYTAPYITVISTNVINTEKLTEGDTLVMEIVVDNPQQMTFTRVLINGEYFTVSAVTTQTEIRVEFRIGSEYKGGTTEFVVEKIEGHNYNQARAFDINGNNVGYAFVNGDIFVDSLKIVDAFDESLDYVMPGEDYFIKIEFDNPTGYQITALSLSYLGILASNKFTVSEDKQTIRIKVTSMESNTTIHINLSAFTYTVDQESKTKNVDNVSDFIVCVVNSNYQMIYTPLDLANMRRGYSYKLANDIDLTDYNWIPKDLNYIVLDGNGFAINNLRNVKTYTDTYVYYGLFSSLYASTIKNLTMNDVLIMITVNNSTTQQNYDSRVGALAGSIGSSSIENVNINGEISVTNNTTTYGSYVGGLAGQIDGTSIEKSYMDMMISNDDYYTGLIAGYAWRTNVNQVFIEGSVFGKEYVGGIFGSSNNSKITNTYVYANLTSTASTGGLIGYASSTLIEDSYYIGNMYTTYTWGNGGLTGNAYGTSITNSFSHVKNQSLGALYSFDSGSVATGVYTTGNDSYSTTLDLAGIVEVMKLVWDLDLWSFKGVLPVLKWEPTIRIIDVVSHETSISFDVTSTDFDQVGEIISVELYLGNSLVQTLTDFSSLLFSNLRYNTEYRIKVTYMYDYHDGQGETEIYDYIDIKTLPTTGSPEVVIKDVVVGSNTVSFELNIKDPNHVGSILSVELFNLDGLLMDTLDSFADLSFENLESNTSYRVVVTYQFDLGDSYGAQQLVTKQTFRTNPYFELNETTVLNTEAVITGDTIVIELAVDNPDGVQFTGVTINGIIYPINHYDTDSIRIDLEANESLGMGEVTLEIDNLLATFESRALVYAFDSNNEVMIFINGDIYVQDIRALNLNGELLEYAMNGESYIAEISLYNPSGYDIPQIVLNGSTILSTSNKYSINADKNIIKVELVLYVNQYTTYQNVYISSINYSNTHMNETKTRQVSGINTFIPIVKSRDIRTISNANELKLMVPGYIYKLTSDINMQGVSWTPLMNFYGVFDGNHHVISNLSIVKTFEDTTAYVGLFGSTSGAIIKNVQLTNVNFVITIKSSGTGNYEGRIGAIVGYAYSSIIKNVIVNANISADNQTGFYSTHTGGIAGYLSGSVIDIAQISGNYLGQSYVGAVVGNTDSSKLSNIYTNATIVGNNYAGTFVGQLYNSELRNSFANGIVNYYGFVGYVNSSSIIENVISMSKMPDGNYAYDYNNQQKSYDVYSPTYSSNGTIISYDQMIAIMKTKWDLNVWSFGEDIPMLKFIPKAFFTSVVADIDGVVFNFNIKDFQQVGELVGIELRQNGTTIQTLTDLSVRKFDVLRYSTEYEIVLIYEYVFDELLGSETIEFKHKFMTADKENVPTVDFIDVIPTQESVIFDLVINDTLEIGVLNAIRLLDGTGVIQSLTNLSTRGFTNLLSNHEYIIEVEYAYDFDDGFGFNTLVRRYEFETGSKATPYFTNVFLTPQNDAILISNVTVSDLDDLLVFVAYRLYKNTTLIKTSSEESFSVFDGLLSSNTYRFEMEYQYNLNDGYGTRTLVHVQEIATIASQIPTVNLVTSASQTVITYNASLIDLDMVGTIKRIDLYNNLGVQVGTRTTTSGTFTGLTSYQSYEVRTYYEYSKNDGTNPVQLVHKQTVKTSPELSIDSMSILNTEAIIVGDTLVLRVYLNNPSAILFRSGVINGVTYQVSSASPDVIRFDISVGSQFDGGATILEVTSLTGSIEQDQFSIPMTTSNTIEVMINGEINILSVQSLDLNYQAFDYYSKYTNYYLAIQFDNPTGYTVESIKIEIYGYGEQTYTNIVYDQVNQIAYVSMVSGGYDIEVISVTQFTYSNENLPSRNRVSSKNCFFTLVSSLTPIEIDTPQELQAMTNGKVYKLMSDIDLTGFNWQPIMNFKGVFDGNGYAINNLNIVKTYEDTTTYVGLFGNVSNSVIKNIDLNNVNIIVNTKSAANLSYEMYVGGLAGHLNDYTQISNVDINGYVSGTNTTNSSSYIGGISGYIIGFVYISQSSYQGELYSNTISSARIGGIVGNMYSRSLITNSYANIKITGNANYAGGIIGYASNVSSVTNSYSVGSISNYSGYSGGMIGYIYDGCYLSNVYSNVQRSGSNIISVGYNYGCILNQVYSLVYGTNQIILTHENMLIAVESSWDHDIWDFVNTDLDGNPTLK